MVIMAFWVIAGKVDNLGPDIPAINVEGGIRDDENLIVNPTADIDCRNVRCGVIDLPTMTHTVLPQVSQHYGWTWSQ